MTNNQINYWKVESERQKWQNEVAIASKDAETRRIAAEEQARHNLEQERLSEALNNIEQEYKRSMVDIQRAYNQEQVRIADRQNALKQRQMELNYAIDSANVRINQSKAAEIVRHNKQDESLTAVRNLAARDKDYAAASKYRAEADKARIEGKYLNDTMWIRESHDFENFLLEPFNTLSRFAGGQGKNSVVGATINNLLR